MVFLLVFTGFICLAGLVITLIYINVTDHSYSSEKSFTNLSWMYLVLVPIAILIVIVLAFLL
ncbi:BshB3 potential contributor to bacillithiol synthesis [Alkalicoccobacillus murimartini]|uniref:BshB3 potential contributor to bacillithiol synthesis n=1 Tax=Alkalicoccobacillus murimartini TaxID=171685 RepID=A0ABT9YG87_9BACI|nr:BshB3 potential contributor to bacillithiol synthesis [Alkalicoccobacillus murimartini]MDQ0206883.1 hypothetical protein [Alkalicoccobacillus murimartini]